MTAVTATRMFLNDGTGTSANTIVGWLIAQIKRRHFSTVRRSGNVRLSDATLSDLGITREQAEFSQSTCARH